MISIIYFTLITLLMYLKMFMEMACLKDYDHIKIYDNEITFDDMKILALKSSHDAVASRNFIIEEKDTSLVQITDTGYIKSKYFRLLKNRDVYFIESNHDIEMLTHGPYPDYLKKRVLSDEGHLSNQASGFYLSKLIGDKTKQIVLMHLSETNNTESKPMETIKNTFKEYDIKFKNIKCARQNEISEVINI